MKLITTFIIATVLSFTAVTWAEDNARPGVTLVERAESPKLNDLAVAPRVVDKQPDGASNSHPADVGTLYCWASIQNSGEQTSVKTIWRFQDRVIAEPEATVGKSIRWRSWTRQRINPDLKGAWSCEIVDAQGTSLGKAEFTVQ